MYSASADFTGQWMSKSYNNLEIRSLYGIYDRTTGKMGHSSSIQACFASPATIVSRFDSTPGVRLINLYLPIAA